jgi:hypothetical protein
VGFVGYSYACIARAKLWLGSSADRCEQTGASRRGTTSIICLPGELGLALYGV